MLDQAPFNWQIDTIAWDRQCVLDDRQAVSRDGGAKAEYTESPDFGSRIGVLGDSNRP